MMQLAAKHPAKYCRVLFYCLLLLNSTYIQGAYPWIGAVIVMAASGLSVATLDSKSRIRQIADGLIITVALVFWSDNEIVNALVGLVYYDGVKKHSKIERRLFLSLLIYLTLKTILYEYIPGLCWAVVWAYSLPGVIIVTVISVRSKKETIAWIILIGATISHAQQIINTRDQESDAILVGSIDEKDDIYWGGIKNTKEIMNAKVVRVGSSQKLSPVEKNHQTYVISLASTPFMESDSLVNKNKDCQFVFFGEHDDFRGFTKKNPIFNNDSYKRIGPWDLHKPFMAYGDKIASKNDPLYCSNIGCTINNQHYGIPVMWDYDSKGRVKVLGMKRYENHRMIRYYGDSDPLVGFLAPYNTKWLKSILNDSKSIEVLIWESVLIAAFLIALVGRKLGLSYILMISVVCLVKISDLYGAQVLEKADISVEIKGRILNPHYESHYSSLIKNLVEQGFTVRISDDRVGSVAHMVIIETELMTKDLKASIQSQGVICVLLPGARLNIDGYGSFKADLVPQGEREVKLNEGRVLRLYDARDVISHGSRKEYFQMDKGSVIILGTGKPSSIAIK